MTHWPSRRTRPSPKADSADRRSRRGGRHGRPARPALLWRTWDARAYDSEEQRAWPTTSNGGTSAPSPLGPFELQRPGAVETCCVAFSLGGPPGARRSDRQGRFDRRGREVPLPPGEVRAGGSRGPGQRTLSVAWAGGLDRRHRHAEFVAPARWAGTAADMSRANRVPESPPLVRVSSTTTNQVRRGECIFDDSLKTRWADNPSTSQVRRLRNQFCGGKEPAAPGSWR